MSSNTNAQARFIKLNFPEEPQTFDPRKGGDVISSTIHFMLFEGLTRLTETSSCDLGLAKKIDVSEDKLTYTFHLREASWSDGSPITAKDFEYSWKSMLDPVFPCPNANLLYPILNAEPAKRGAISLDAVGIRSLDDLTLEVKLEIPTPYFLELIAFCVFSPVHHKLASQHPDWAEHLSEYYVSSGPFRLVRWKYDNEIVVEKNPHYWDTKTITMDGVHISIIKDESTALQMFDRGELDFLGSPYTTIPIDAAKSLKESNRLQARPVGATMICSFNTQKKLFSNKWIRTAFSLAIDREAVVGNIGILDEHVACNAVPPVLKKGRDRAFIPAFDLVLAKVCLQKGLDELGLTLDQIQDLTMIYTRRETNGRISQILQQQWLKHLGIKVNLQAFERKIFFDQLKSGDFDLCQYSWYAQYNDQMNILDRFKYRSNPLNLSKWENSEFIQYLNDSFYCADEERDAILEKAEELFMDEAVVAPLFHMNSIYVQQPYLKGVYTSPIGSIHFYKAYFAYEK